jgi:octaheme c-type cytochrome (tetrathionate reductase family)
MVSLRAHAAGLVLAFTIATSAGAAGIIEDHQVIEGPFASGPEVTEVCLACHEDAAYDLMKTSHWLWYSPESTAGGETAAFGKRNALSSYCLTVAGNWPRCTSCHTGYGWRDADFDFTDPGNVDCLVCHDGTGQYRKFPTGAGHPVYEPQEWDGELWEPVDLAMVARSAGLPTRRNCGACHFFGGGGNNVKHGDLDSTLIDCDAEFDVHMGSDGADLLCQDCHTTEDHRISGRAMSVSPRGGRELDCTECHDTDVHAKKVLNWHTRSVACQTCHIPTFARSQPTNVWWDWSTAGQDQPEQWGELGEPTYLKKKGTLRWAKDIVPTYAWYNGRAGVYRLGDLMDPDGVTRLNWPSGSKQDLKALIYPFKVHRGRQPYDAQRHVFIAAKLYGPGGFWQTYDWNQAAAAGMQAAGLEYSGEYGFAETVMYWRINHLVVPAGNALRCNDCHAPNGNGRLDWQALGYEGDPLRERGLSRYALKEVYENESR